MTKCHSLVRESDNQIRMGGREQKIKALQKQNLGQVQPNQGNYFMVTIVLSVRKVRRR